jgi:hypothetical protein
MGALVGVAISLAATAPPPAAAAGPERDSFSGQHRLGFQSGDDWEPAIAADRFGHVYVLYKHYDVAGGGTCVGCDVHLLVQRSDDSGETWSSPVPIAPGAVAGGQFDSQLAVDPVDGRTVWASFLENSNSVIQVVRSVDFGRTWSVPVTVSAGPPNKDKDSLAVRGDHVVVAYDDGFNTWASVSTDGGEHWRQRLYSRAVSGSPFPSRQAPGLTVGGEFSSVGTASTRPTPISPMGRPLSGYRRPRTAASIGLARSSR